MRKLKVMHLIDNMGDGGAQRIVINYLRDFQYDKDIELKVFVYNNSLKSQYTKEIEDNKYNVEFLSNKLSCIRIPYIKRFFNKKIARREWEKCIKEYKPDIVHTHISPLLETAGIAAKKAKVPLRFSTLHSNPHRFKGIQLNNIKKAFNEFHFIPICVTNEQAIDAKQCYGFKDYEVVRNGIDFNKILLNKKTKKEARRLLSVSEDSFIVAGVGRLDPIKNFSLLINSFKHIANVNNNCILLFAGEGPEKKKLLALAKKQGLEKHVLFLGNRTDIENVYCAADVVGMTSISEASPLTILEAQTCGTRCVISDGVTDESIISNHVCKMPKNATEKEWADALMDVSFIGNKVLDFSDYEVSKMSLILKEIYLRRWNEQHQ